LDKLRKIPRRGAQDPRIDLTEAAVAQALGNFKLQQAAASRAAVEGEAQGSRLLVALARHREGFALDRLGEVARASLAAEEARKIYQEAGDRIGLARALNAIGSLAVDHGDLEKAKAAWGEALTIREQIGNRWGVAASLDNIGLVLWEQGDLSSARRNLERGYGIFRELGDQPAIASDLENLAGLFTEMGDLAAAKRMGEQGRTLARQIGDKNEEALVLGRLAVVMQAEGDLAAAEAAHREVLSMQRKGGTQDAVADTLFQLGEVLKWQGDLASARLNHDEALTIRTAMRAAFSVAKSQVALANLSIEDGRPETVPSLVRSASAVFAQQKAIDWEATAQAALARSWLVRGDAGEAQRAIEHRSPTGRSQSPRVRLEIVVTTARISAANGKVDDAQQALEAALAEATRLRLVGPQLDVRLARGEIGLESGRKDAPRDLAVLATDARARGFGLVVRKAEALLRKHPQSRGMS